MSEEKVEQLLSTLERLEKAGELKKFLKEVPEISRQELWKSTMIPPVLEGFKKMHDFCMMELSLHLSEMEKEIKNNALYTFTNSWLDSNVSKSGRNASQRTNDY